MCSAGVKVTEGHSSDPVGQFRSGFACFVGRPNAGKSTLTNALVGQKIVIESSKPQTTRHAVRGIVRQADAQLVIIDTPGLHKPRTLLGERLNDVVRATWSEVDVVGVCLPADQRIGPGDRYLVSELAALPKTPQLVAIATKSDLVPSQRMAEHLVSIADLENALKINWADIVPVSATQHFQLDVLSETLIGLLPGGQPLYPDGEITDEPEETLVAELIREAALEEVTDELPHSITVTVDEMGLRDGRPAEQAAARHLRVHDRRAGLPEGDCHRPSRQPAAADRRGGPAADRGIARNSGLSRSPGESAQGMAKEPQASEPVGFCLRCCQFCANVIAVSLRQQIIGYSRAVRGHAIMQGKTFACSAHC